MNDLIKIPVNDERLAQFSTETFDGIMWISPTEEGGRWRTSAYVKDGNVEFLPNRSSAHRKFLARIGISD